MNKKIVLFKPYVFSATRPYYGAPLGLLSVSRILDKEGYKIKIITPVTHKHHIQTVIKEAKDAICLGITSMTGYSIYDGLKAARAVRKKYPNLPLVWGGWHPSILPVETAKDANLDSIIALSAILELGNSPVTFPVDKSTAPSANFEASTDPSATSPTLLI